jgi:hypothetical protein
VGGSDVRPLTGTLDPNVAREPAQQEDRRACLCGVGRAPAALDSGAGAHLVNLIKPFKDETNSCVHADYKIPDQSSIKPWKIYREHFAKLEPKAKETRKPLQHL